MNSRQGVKISRDTDCLRRFETESGIPVKDLYSPDDIKGVDYILDLGDPGEYPTQGGHIRGCIEKCCG